MHAAGERRPRRLSAARLTELLSAGIVLAAAAVFAAACHARAEAGRPARIVSTNLCADSLVLALASPARIQSVSHLARDPLLSNVVDEAGGIPVNHGRAEEIIGFGPDLVVSWGGQRFETDALLRRLGYRVLVLSLADSLSAVRERIRELAAVLGEQARAEALIAEMDLRLASAEKESAGRPVRAAVFGPNGYTAGRRTIIHEVLSHGGLVNYAAERGIRNYGHLNLEMLVYDPPAVLVLDDHEEQKNSLAQRLLVHEVVGGLARRTHVVTLARRLWLCPGPWLAEAAEELVRKTAGIRH